MDYAVFLAFVPLALALLATVAWTAWRRRPEGTSLTVLSVLCIGWITTNALEVWAPTPAGTYRFAQATYLFSSFAPAAWLAFACAFTDRMAWTRSWAFRLLLVLNAATAVAALTNPLHGLLWPSVGFVPVGRMLGMTTTHGPWFFAHAALCWVVMLLGSGLVVREYAEAYRSTRRISVAIALGALLPVVCNVLYVAHLIPTRKDFTSLTTAAGAVLMARGLYRYRLLTYRPVARNVLIESLHEGMLVLDVDGQIVDVNPALQRMLHLTAEPVGQPVATVLPGFDPAQPSAEIAFAQGDLLRYFSLRVSPLTLRSGRPAGHLVLLHDTTARRLAETALRHMNAVLEARNDDLDAFARTVAHDLKNPIHVIQGLADLLLDMGDEMPATARTDSVATILQQAQHMDEIVRALLLLAGVNRQTITPEPVSMAPVVARVVARLARQIEQAGATLDVPDVWPCVLGYGPWIEEVWANYVSNALKYGGAAPHLTLGFDAPSGGAVRFWVQDAGPGLTQEASARLFQPFSRVGDSQAEGHGLGLSIVRRIVEKLGGEVGVESTGIPGEGARFTFTLPCAPEACTSGEPAVRQCVPA